MMQTYFEIFDDPAWMKEALRAGKIGLWKIIVDPATGTGRMLANETMLNLLGLVSHPTPEACFTHWRERIDNAYLPQVERAVSDLTSGLYSEVEYPWTHPSRGRIFIRCGGRLVPSEDGLLHLMGYHQDVTELQIVRQSLKESLSRLEMTYRDALTGVLTRPVFYDNARRELLRAARRRQPVALIMADIDHFKKVNDTYGHLVGDAVLQECAARLQARLRGEDLCGRFGGEEFIVLLPETDSQSAFGVAEDIRRRCADAPVLVEGTSIPVTISLGVYALLPEELREGPNRDKLLENGIDRADKAMYRAKQGGRNRVCTWENVS